jgi:hypothetical protein
MEYFYLLASLPKLELNVKLEISREEFLDQCRQSPVWVNIDDITDLLNGNYHKVRQNFIMAWSRKDIIIRNAVVRLRGSRKNINPKPFFNEVSEADLNIEASVEDAFDTDDILKRELAIDQLRFRLLDEMTFMKPFNQDSLYAYAVKFSIAERWSKLETENGRMRVLNFVKTVQTNE